MALLPAGWAMRRAALEARASLPAARCAAGGVVSRGRRPPDEQPQRLVVRTLFVSLRQGVRVHRPKQRSASGVNHGDDDLG